MSDRPSSGPAPRWGEYGPAPEPTPPARPDPPAAADQRLTPSGRAPAAAAAAAAPAWDRVVTVALLALGLVNVLFTIPEMLALPRALDQVYAAQGFGRYTSDSLASAIGIAINAVDVLLLVVAVLLAVRRLRSGRIAFWIPLVAGATALVVTGALLTVAMLGDPAMPAYLQSQSTSSP